MPCQYKMLTGTGLRRDAGLLAITSLIFQLRRCLAVHLGGASFSSLVSSPAACCEAALVPFADSNTLSPQKDASDRHLSRAALIGVSVGSAVGASLIAVMLFVLIYCMCRKKTLNRKQKTAAGMQRPRVSEKARNTPSSLSTLKDTHQKKSLEEPQIKSLETGEAVVSDGEHQTARSSDSDFVLPELGGKDSHIKFDGMAWVDIKGLDDQRGQRTLKARTDSQEDSAR